MRFAFFMVFVGSAGFPHEIYGSAGLWGILDVAVGGTFILSWR